MNITWQVDVFGVVFVGGITAFGGGILRDTILDISPPSIFSNYIIFAIAIISALFVFIIAYINKEKFTLLKLKIEHVNNFFDAVGLAAFSVTGAEIGYKVGYSDNPLVIVIVGMVTGIGGGIMRDILIDTTPYVFKKHIYALASIIGIVLYYTLRKYINNIFIDSIISMFTIILIRLLATKYHWSLPKVTLLANKEEYVQNFK